MLIAVLVIFRCKDRLHINRRNTFQRHGNRLRHHKPFHAKIPFPGKTFGQHAKQCHIQLIGALPTARERAIADLAAHFARMFCHLGNIIIGHDIFRRAQANTVMAGGKVKKSAARRGGRHRHDAFADIIRPTAQQRVQNHRRQGKIVNQMGFVLLAKIRQVFNHRQVGFGNKHQIGCHGIGRQTQCLDDFMGLFGVNGCCAGFFPDEPDRIKPNHTDPVTDIIKHDFQNFKKHIGVAVIKINLIIAKGTPDMLWPQRGFNQI